MTPWDYTPALRLRRDAPGAQWALWGLRLIVLPTLALVLIASLIALGNAVLQLF